MRPGGTAPKRSAFVLHIAYKHRAGAEERPGRDAQSCLDEAIGLTAAIGLEVVAAHIITLGRATPATLIGRGKVEEIASEVRALEPEVIVVNAQLSPVQQRNLERAWKAKVLDRTALILEIFGERAKTREGRLQVELAHLTYQRSRLVRSWTHLERQRGGFGFLGGPGETQIETDRRLIGERLARIRKELEEVKRTRGLHRTARKRVPYPVVALVGYTNAGKSTLFNRLTQSEVMAEDLLFATLDPTMRGLRLPDRRQIILSDTVGFIADLPHELVAAFQATLEEVLEADVIVHVRDAAHPESAEQKADVLTVLAELGIDPQGERPIVECLNKIDLMEPPLRDSLLAHNADPAAGAIAISAITGEGLAALLARIGAALNAAQRELSISLDPTDGAALAWLYQNTRVLDRRDGDEAIALKIAVDPQNVDRVRTRYGGKLLK